MPTGREWVVDRQMVPWAVTASIIGILYFIWFVVVLVGEAQGWTDDPSAWAGLPTEVWAFLGIAYYVALVVFLIALLVRREVPARMFRIGDDGRLVGSAGRQIQVTKSSSEKEPEHVHW